MRYCHRLLVPGAILALVISALLPLTSSATTFTISAANFAFSPSTLTISAGDTVKWVWVNGIHTTTSGSPCTADGLWSAPVDMQHQSFSRAFPTAGTFPFFCQFHCATGMTGVITVNAQSGVPEAGPVASADHPVLSASPNPFHGPTTVSFNLPQAGQVRLAVYNAAGRQVALLANGSFGAGAHNVTWDGKASGGGALPGGVYFATTVTPQGVARTTLIKID